MASTATARTGIPTASGANAAHVPELDGLRAVAILLVLGCHYQGFAIQLGRLPEFGWVGVDIFFALSGYLITSILLRLRNQPSAYRIFYSRRAIRILPPYIVTVALTILVAAASGNASLISARVVASQIFFLQAFPTGALQSLLHLLRHPLQTAGSASLLRFAHHLAFGSAGATPSLHAQLGAYWSLSIEEYFYLLWAPVVLACSRKTVAATAIAACVAEALLRYFCNSADVYFCAFFRFDALLYGALLALALDWRPHYLPRLLRPLRAIFAIAVCGLAAIAFLLRPVIGREIRESPLFLSIGLALVSLASTALIGLLIAKTGSRWWPARLLRTKWMRDIGRISYTMYLTHIAVAALLLQCIRHFAPGAGSLNLAESVVAMELTIGVAALSWRLLEGPAQRWKNRQFAMRPAAASPIPVRRRLGGILPPSPDGPSLVSLSAAVETEPEE